MTRCLTASLSVLALMIAASSVQADVKGKVEAMQSPADSKQFAMKAAEGGMLEVKLAQLAQQKSQSQEVKQLAQKIEQDHTKANQELMAVCKQKNINLPSDLQNPECKETLEAFQQLQGKDFDNAYLLHNAKDHLMDIMMFRQEAKSGTDQEIKQWATKTLPTLQQHAQEIHTVAMSAGMPMDVFAGGGTEGARTAGSRQEGTGTSGTPRTGTPDTPRTGTPNTGKREENK